MAFERPRLRRAGALKRRALEEPGSRMTRVAPSQGPDQAEGAINESPDRAPRLNLVRPPARAAGVAQEAFGAPREPGLGEPAPDRPETARVS
jgi:hypothetical protein